MKKSFEPFRAKFSDKWINLKKASRFPVQNPDREGNVIMVSRDGEQWHIVFDGTKSAQAYHKSYLVKVEAQD